jgi:hypothetical protein
MKKLSLFLFALMIFCFPQPSEALPIYGEGIEGLGSFTGSITYSASSDVEATLTVELTNTTSFGDGGYITAFAFNNPGELITGVTLKSPDFDFAPLGGSDFQDGIRAQPFGYFDIGASVTGDWLSGGGVDEGIAVGNAETFIFTLEGTGLGDLSEQSFVDELSENGENMQFFAVRFRGISNSPENLSDKAGGVPVPEPATMLMVGAGLIGMAAFGRKKFIKKS